MSNKRQATTDLNHDNWDQDDPADHEEMGTYKVALREVLEKRVIRTAKRRTQVSSTGEEAKKSVFSGFGGFNKTQPSSFDFLSNLTNGNKTNGSTENKPESSVSSSLFSNSKSPVTTSASSGFFSIPVTTSSTKPVFGSPSTQASPIFGSPTTQAKSMFGSPTTQAKSMFSASPVTNTSPSLFSVKDDTKADSTFKPPPTTKTETTDGFTFKSNSISNTTAASTTVQTSPFQKFNNNVFAPTTTSTQSSPFKMQPISNTTATESADTNSSDKKTENNEKDAKKLAYYAKLKGLNESVFNWIKKHVEETPLCILTPIFKDYEKHLKAIQEESDDILKKDGDSNALSLSSKNSESTVESVSPSKTSASSLFSATAPNSNFALTGSDKSTASVDEKPSTPFSFGIKTSPKPTSTLPATTGFSFGITKTANPTENKTDPAPSPFGASAPAPFSFGIGQKFSFSPNTVKPEATSEEKTDKEDEDQPPKVEFTPVVEENSVFEKRCKIFVKKDGNFADKGVGTLYIKKIEETGKHQLIVRANTNLGTVLVNTILGSAIPTQRMGKNNVMMVCIPTPDAKPPPTPILIRVKTAEEADELLETLNNYKA